MARRKMSNKGARNHRRPLKRQRRASRRNTRPVLPPAKTLMGHVMRTVVQTAWDIAQGALSLGPVQAPSNNPTSITQSFDTERLLNGTHGSTKGTAWFQRFRGLFYEIKVHSITAHYMPYESITTIGEYVCCLCDDGENAVPNSFAAAIGMPASVVRKTGQPARLTWYPTEPEDRNWIQLTSDHTWCSFYLFEAETAYADDLPGKTTPQKLSVGVQGKVVFEVNASFRGKPSAPTSADITARESPPDSHAYLEFKRLNPCMCRKCLPGLLKKLFGDNLDPIQSVASSPYQLMDCGALNETLPN